jgi:uncharacterized protein YlaI
MYKCPECGEDMVVAQEPVVQAQEVKEMGQLWPVKIVCHVINLYACNKCNVRIAKTETREYYDNVS